MKFIGATLLLLFFLAQQPLGRYTPKNLQGVWKPAGQLAIAFEIKGNAIRYPAGNTGWQPFFLRQDTLYAPPLGAEPSEVVGTYIERLAGDTLIFRMYGERAILLRQ